MTSREKHEPPRGSPPRALSRTLAIVAVAVLLAIAVGGIVVSAWRGRSQAGDGSTAATVSEAASAARPPRPAHHPGDPYHIAFAGESEQLSADAVDDIRAMAESVKDATNTIVLSGKIEATGDRAARLALTKKRLYVVMRALIAHGLAPGRVRIEVAEYPVGRVRPGETDVVVMDVR